jgi:uncharacterized RDD family membrane protein YckC
METGTTPTPTAAVSPARRFIAAAIDWFASLVLFYLLFFSSALLLALAGGDSGDGTLPTALLVLPGALGVLAYFTWARARGVSLGMRAAGVRVVDADTGKQPSGARAFARSVLSLLVGASVFVLLVVAFSDRPEAGYAPATWMVVGVALAVVCAGALGHLWMLLDPRRQSHQDRLLHLAVVEGRAGEA